MSESRFLNTEENSFRWGGRSILCKDLVPTFARPYLAGMNVRRIIDIASGTNEEIVGLAPDAEEYHFLDSHFLPEPKPRYHLHRQRAGDRINVPDGYFDVMSSNGSFDHMRQSERIDAFLEAERCLRSGGILLFGCEYFDYDSPEIFLRMQRDADIVARNCMAFDNINLREICDRLTRLTMCQRDLSKIPGGEPLRDLASPEETEFYTQVSTSGQRTTWGAFFAVFVKR